MSKLIKPKPKTEDPFSIEPDVLLFSDLHLHDRKEFSKIDPKTGLNIRLLEGLNILDQIEKICDKHKIQAVYDLGDPIELKDKVPNHILIELEKRIFSISRFRDLYSLLGNHNFNLLNYPTLAIYQTMTRFQFISESGMVGSNTYFITYQRDYEDFKKIWKAAHTQKPEIICFHQELPGAVYESGKPVGGVLDLEFDPKIQYLSGHLHKAQKVGPVQYLGSPYPTKFLPNDDGNYFVWLLNSQTKRLTTLKLNYSSFIDLEWYGLEIPKTNDLKEFVDGNYIRIVGEVLKEDINQESKKTLKENLEKFGAKAVIFNIKIKHQEQIERTDSSLISDQEIIRTFAKQNSGDFDLDELTKVGENIYESV